jgi:hypothetical protein
MKRIFCIALILIGAIGVFAQERTISKTEFDALFKNPNRLAPFIWKGKTWRNIITTETKAEGKNPVDSSTKSISLYAPWQKSHTFLESRTGSKITKRETIRLGDKIYTRNENEAWTVEAFAEKPKTETPTASAPVAVESKFERSNEYKYLGSEKLNSQMTNVYVYITKTKGADPSTNIERAYTHTSKYWFNEDGTLLKEDRVIEGRGETGTLFNRLTIIYELDPNIIIEAPLMNRVE